MERKSELRGREHVAELMSYEWLQHDPESPSFKTSVLVKACHNIPGIFFFPLLFCN